MYAHRKKQKTKRKHVLNPDIETGSEQAGAGSAFGVLMVDSVAFVASPNYYLGKKRMEIEEYFIIRLLVWLTIFSI